MRIDDVDLEGWQEDVIKTIETHDAERENEQWQGVPDYVVNKGTGVTIAFPKGYGHTFLANYIASKYPTLLVYTSMDHYRELSKSFPFHQDTQTVSMHEIFYAVYKPSKAQPTPEFFAIRKKFEGKKVIVVDNALSVSDEIKDLIYNNSPCIVVMLGH